VPKRARREARALAAGGEEGKGFGCMEGAEEDAGDICRCVRRSLIAVQAWW
jgi:hypothetical protein